MMFIRFLEQVGKNDVKTAGGKGASLGETLRIGVQVPNGFVILANTFDKVIEENRVKSDIMELLAKTRYNDAGNLEATSKKITAIITACNVPKEITEEIYGSFKALSTRFVAVRSSATAEDNIGAAWAGQLESYLNTTETTLIDNVKSCWASLFTPRTIFYSHEKGFTADEISVAVIIQKMVASNASGIVFSVHPVTQDRNQIFIEAGRGLGEAIVSAQVTPDSYIVDKKSRKIIERKINRQDKMLIRAKEGGNMWKRVPNPRKQKLSNKDIHKLAALTIRIEKHYAHPCDIEWALEGRKLYITQVRPITTLKSKGHAGGITSYKTNKLNEALSLLRTQTWKWRWSGNWPLLDGIFQSDYRFTNALEEISGVTLGYSVDFYKGPVLSTYYSQEDYDWIHKSMISKFKSNPRYLLKCLSGFDEKVNHDLSELQHVAFTFKETAKPTNIELARLFNASRKCYPYNAAMDMFCIYAEDALLPLLKKAVEKRISEMNMAKRKIDPYIVELTTPTKPSTFSLGRRSFFDIVDKLRKSNIKPHLRNKQSFLNLLKKQP